MLKIKRPATPSYFKLGKVRDAKERLKRHFERHSQERFKFDNELLRPITELLLFAFKDRCAYCETPIGKNLEDRMIDRFRPPDGAYGLDNEFDRNHYWWLAYEWKNLYPCCINCGKFKDNSFPIERGTDRAAIGAMGNELDRESYLLIDPCRDNPASHLDFNSEGKAFGKTLKGEVTVKILNLNREDLILGRRDAASKFLKLIDFDLQDLRDNFEIRIEQAFAKLGNRDFEGALRIIAKRIIQSSPPPVSYSEFIANRPDSSLTDHFIFSAGQNRFSPFSIKSIEIHNFRTIGHVSLNVPRSLETDQERWLLLLGDNGIGKSSILQAIALTLSGKAMIKKLRVHPGDLLKQGETEGYVRIFSYEQRDPIELKFNQFSITRAIEIPVTYLIGYGATRLLPKGRAESWQI